MDGKLLLCPKHGSLDLKLDNRIYALYSASTECGNSCELKRVGEAEALEATGLSEKQLLKTILKYFSNADPNRLPSMAWEIKLMCEERLGWSPDKEDDLPSFEEAMVTDPQAAVDILFGQAVRAVPKVVEQRIPPDGLWDSPPVQAGEGELKELILDELRSYSSRDTFVSFIIRANRGDDFAQVMVFLGDTFAPIRLWRTRDSFFACGGPDFGSNRPVKADSPEQEEPGPAEDASASMEEHLRDILAMEKGASGPSGQSGEDSSGEPLDEGVPHFEVGLPAGDGLCSDNACPCDEERIPRGEGYLYIPQSLVDFRCDALSHDELKAKIMRMRQEGMAQGSFVLVDPSVYNPVLMCRLGAELRGLDMEVAARDAKTAWDTGWAPLRVTPLAGAKPAQPLGEEQKPAPAKPRVTDQLAEEPYKAAETPSSTAAAKTKGGISPKTLVLGAIGVVIVLLLIYMIISSTSRPSGVEQVKTKAAAAPLALKKPLDFSMVAGIKRGDSVNDVIALYGEPGAKTKGALYYWKQGLSFHFDLEGKINKTGLKAMKRREAMPSNAASDQKLKIPGSTKQDIIKVLGKPRINGEALTVYEFHKGGSSEVRMFLFYDDDLRCNSLEIQWLH